MDAVDDTSTPLKRQLGLSTLLAVIIGETIGVGIFLTPAGMAHGLASPFWLLVVWLVMGLMALTGALCYGELAARYPAAGGNYVYLREAFGLPIAFLYGWMALLVMDPGITASLGVAFATYLAFIVPLSGLATKAAAMLVIVALALLHVFGVRQGARAVRGLTWLKLYFLGFIAVMAVLLQAGDVAHFVPFVARPADAEPLFGALAAGLVGAFFAFGGWWEVSKLAGEVEAPGRVMPRALVLGVSAVTVIYIVTSAVFIYLVAPAQVTDNKSFVAQAGRLLFDTAGGWLFATVVIVAVLGSLAGVLMAAPRVYFAMARDGVFFHAIGALHPRYGTPARAIAVQAGLACLLVAVGTFDQILAYFIFTVVIFLGLTVLGLIVIRRRGGPAPEYQTPGYPLTPAIYLLLVLVLLVLLFGHSPMEALSGLAVVALGLPVYFALARRRAAT